jgi:polysaccharide deacetylase family protein (PEP-CTERM system associated)
VSTGVPAHIFSVDVEEHFQVSVFETHISRSSWASLPSRVGQNVDRILAVLDEFGALGTFFVLGWIADKHPEVVRRIADQGHEIASHGWSHRKVTTLSRDEFRDEVRTSRRLLEDLCGRPVRGYRAPSFSIVPSTAWALDILSEEGYRYDSSLFPIRRRGYGFPGAESTPHLIRCNSASLLELPLATTVLGGLRVPAAGGAYFRLLPYRLTRRAFRECEAAGRTGVFYIHPWELDLGQPRYQATWTARFRHYRGLERTLPRLRELLSEFRFTSVEKCYRPGEREADVELPVVPVPAAV